MTAPDGPEPPPASTGWRATAFLDAMLGLVAAVLTVIGTFMPLFGGEVRGAGQVLTMTITGWDSRSAVALSRVRSP